MATILFRKEIGWSPEEIKRFRKNKRRMNLFKSSKKTPVGKIKLNCSPEQIINLPPYQQQKLMLLLQRHIQEKIVPVCYAGIYFASLCFGGKKGFKKYLPSRYYSGPREKKPRIILDDKRLIHEGAFMHNTGL